MVGPVYFRVILQIYRRESHAVVLMNDWPTVLCLNNTLARCRRQCVHAHTCTCQSLIVLLARAVHERRVICAHQHQQRTRSEHWSSHTADGAQRQPANIDDTLCVRAAAAQNIPEKTGVLICRCVHTHLLQPPRAHTRCRQ
jgi:heme exporter protein D